MKHPKKKKNNKKQNNDKKNEINSSFSILNGLRHITNAVKKRNTTSFILGSFLQSLPSAFAKNIYAQFNNTFLNVTFNENLPLLEGLKKSCPQMTLDVNPPNETFTPFMEQQYCMVPEALIPSFKADIANANEDTRKFLYDCLNNVIPFVCDNPPNKQAITILFSLMGLGFISAIVYCNREVIKEAITNCLSNFFAPDQQQAPIFSGNQRDRLLGM